MLVLGVRLLSVGASLNDEAWMEESLNICRYNQVSKCLKISVDHAKTMFE